MPTVRTNSGFVIEIDQNGNPLIPNIGEKVFKTDLVLDVFGGVCLGGLDAMAMGLSFIAIELESKFVTLGQQNIDLWNRQLKGWPNLGTARIVQGDSRRLGDVIRGASLIVSSPPFMGLTPTAGDPNYDWKFQGDQSNYGDTPGNLANMKEGDIDLVVSSPPYAGSMEKSGGINPDKSDHIGGPHSQMNKSDTRYGSSPGQLGSLKEGDFNSVIGKFDPELIEFFWSNVNIGENCWEWKGNLHDAGYGQFRFKGKRYFAHRLSWELNYGSIPDGLLVCHNCDNPKCVRANHLFIGTKGDNWRDCCEKKRAWMFTNPEKQPRGEDQGSAKLTEEQVREIYDRYHAGGETIEGLAKEYGVSRHPIWTIIHKKAWNHVLGSMKEGSFDLCVSSPPYVDSVKGEHEEKETAIESRMKRRTKGGSLGQSQRHGGYGKSDSQLGSMPEGRMYFPEHGDSAESIAEASGDTFWSASKEILEQCFDLLKPNGTAIFVCKDYIKAKKRVPFSNRWLSLCESVGFRLVCRHQAMLVKPEGEQETIRGPQYLETERKSFFRRNHETKVKATKFWPTLDVNTQNEFLDIARKKVITMPTEKKILQKAQVLAFKSECLDDRPYQDEIMIQNEDVICLEK